MIHPTSDPELWQLFTSGYPGVPVNNAELDTRLTTRFMRISAGHGLESRSPAEGVRECGIQLGGAGRRESMELWADARLWKPLHVRIPGDLVIQAAHVMTGLLAKRLHPEITSAVLGNLQVPVPPVELHIAGGGTVSARGNLMDGPLETLIVLDSFGARRGTGKFYRGGEFLPADLADAGLWDEAVTEALQLIAMDWGFLHPRIG